MNSISATRLMYEQGNIDKPSFIKQMYEEHHAVLYDYSTYLPRTNVKKIEIEDGNVIMTSRDRGIRIACTPQELRIAPIEALNFLDYERLDSVMIENLLSDDDYFFDIGANIGWYSINVAAARRATKVFSFEPIPATYARLQFNLELNQVHNVTAYNFGFSNHAGAFPFYYYRGGSDNASSANVTGRSDVQTVQCEVRTLDDYTDETGIRVDFIKCDVEGAELLVFQGGTNTIARNKPIVFAEILRKWSTKFGYDPNEIFDFFRRQGYRAFTATMNGLSDFGIMNDATIETNFFFLHSEKHSSLIRRFMKAESC